MKDFKILLVDDEEEFVSTLAERLKLRGIHAITAANGMTALDMIEAYHPDVVFLDLLLPDLSGIEVLKKIKSRYPHIKVILMSGQGYTEDEEKGMQLGAFGYLVKPIRIEDLLEKINEAVEK